LAFAAGLYYTQVMADDSSETNAPSNASADAAADFETAMVVLKAGDANTAFKILKVGAEVSLAIRSS
jgi:hypothetical protein